MVDKWTTQEQFVATLKELRNKKFADIHTALAEKVCAWDAEIFYTNLWMSRKMLSLGSFEALSEWMRSDDEEAQTLRWWIQNSGHREIIGTLFRRLKDRDIKELKTALYEG